MSRHIFARLFTRRTALLVLALGLWLGPVCQAWADDLSGVVLVNGRPQKDVVVWLVGGDALPPAPKKIVLDQRQLQFKPHVLAVRTGTQVEMPNSDRVFHNVFSFHDGKRFDLGLYPVGTSRTVTFDRPGLSRIFCNIHPNMAAYVMAVDSEFFAVTDPSGQFLIAAVPPGTYVYHAWHPGGATLTGSASVDGDTPLEVLWP